MKNSLRLLLQALMVALLSVSVIAQVTVPNTLVTGSIIRAGDLNTNFNTLGTHALDRTGGNITGNITVDPGIQVDGVDIGLTVCTTCTPTFGSLTLGTGALALTGTNGVAHVSDTTTNINFPANGQVGMSLTGTQRFLLNASGLTIYGNNILDSSGKVPAISSTYFASLSGANLTALNGSNISNGTVAVARLGSGSPSAANFLRGDGAWTAVPLSTTTSKVANYTAVAGDFVLANGTFTVTLPAAASNANAIIDVKNVGTTTITIGRTGADTIDGATSQSLVLQYQSYTFISDGTNWFIK
jgi:hypothetical protein